ncbi:MAG TPA: helix-turn-helix transcriptional regulator [Gaiellales bacterium]|jgi:tetratricopeptide (TPR) repeat protein|nr:helix-turn-helix transcriptional regulator [Gaiellales bacterium]
MSRHAKTSERRTSARGAGAGSRLRELRTAAGLTQAELGGDRFTKEYVSQVELGKTRPSEAAVVWFADRLRVDRTALGGDAAPAALAATEAAIARAEAATEAHRYGEALEHLAAVRPPGGAGGARLAVRHGLARGWALHHLGRLDEALDVLAGARAAAEELEGGEAERAAVLYRLGVVRFKMGSHATAVSLLDEALRVAAAGDRPSDALRARILNTRAKVRRRQKDFTAAAEDVQQALELAHALNDDRVLAETYLDASLVAERRHEYSLAREYAERSKALYERVSDHEYVGKLLNNLGQLRAITGRPDEAVPLLRESFRIAVEQDNRVDAAFAASSLASARLHVGDLEDAVESANRAIELLSGREEYRQEEGNALLVMGRAHLGLDRIDEAERAFKAAADCFAAVESVSHMAGAWVSLGDVATRRGDPERAAGLYRRAADALQDVRW